MSFLADMVDDVNARLQDPHASVGPSHFMVKNTQLLTESKAKSIWKHSILPAISDRFFDDPDQLKQFSYSEVRKRVDESIKATPNPVIEDEDDDDATPHPS